MAITPPGRGAEPLHVIPMALALVAAAAAGGALGLIWQSTGLGTEGPADAAGQRLLATDENE